jgi:DNA-binding NtrC family response regulator
MDVSSDIMWGKLVGVQRVIEKTAPTGITILIEGETGTGKRLVAKVIHALSSRRDQPFIPLNCASIPDKLMQMSVLVRIVQGGTIFLEEVGDLSAALQVKILPLLERNDIRIIAATKRNLDHAMETGLFSRQLYYRLCVFKIKLPPLRERKEDIIPLAEHFANGRVKKISARAKRLLKSYSWPGNVRELQNCIDRALVLGDRKTIQPEDLPYKVRRCGMIIPAPLESLDHMKEDYILRVLRYTRWNQHDAAQILGISIQALANKLKKYKIRKHKRDKKTLRLYEN